MKIERSKFAVRRNYRSELGASDGDTIFVVLIAVVVMTVGYLALEWVGSVKNARAERSLEAYERRNKKAIEERHEPRGYQVKF